MKIDYKTEQNPVSKRVLSFYTIVMVVLYVGYVAMDYVRMSRSKGFTAKTNMAPEDVTSIEQAGMWMIGFEVSFAILFLIASVVTVYLFTKHENFQLIRNFTVLNIGLFLVVGLLGAGLSLVLPMPVGNLIQIIVIPTYFLVALVLYTVFASRKMKKENELM